MTDISSSELRDWQPLPELYANGKTASIERLPNIDAHENPNTVLSHKVFLVVGHDEYWSRNMRDNVTQGRDAGVHLGIFAGNVLFWQVRFEPSSPFTSSEYAPYRTLTEKACFESEQISALPAPSAVNPAAYCWTSSSIA